MKNNPAKENPKSIDNPEDRDLSWEEIAAWKKKQNLLFENIGYRNPLEWILVERLQNSDLDDYLSLRKSFVSEYEEPEFLNPLEHPLLKVLEKLGLKTDHYKKQFSLLDLLNLQGIAERNAENKDRQMNLAINEIIKNIDEKFPGGVKGALQILIKHHQMMEPRKRELFETAYGIHYTQQLKTKLKNPISFANALIQANNLNRTYSKDEFEPDPFERLEVDFRKWRSKNPSQLRLIEQAVTAQSQQ